MFIKLWAAAALAIGLVGCGLSDAQISSYKKEIAYSTEEQSKDQQLIGDLNQLTDQALAQGLVYRGANDSANKYKARVAAFANYSECLERWMKEGEKFHKAKSACAEESGISRYRGYSGKIF